VYIGHTTKTEFASDTDWVPVGDLTQVFSGNIHTQPLPPTNNQWFEIEFSTPFNYNGTDNIVVAVNEKTKGWSGTPSKLSYTSGQNTGIYARKDGAIGEFYDPANPPTSIGRVNNLPQLQLEGQLASCLLPTGISFTQTSMTSGNISWTTSGSNVDTYDLEWGTAGFTLGSGTQEFGLTTTSHAVTTIEEADYEVYIRQNCTGADGSSAWVGPFAFFTGYCRPTTTFTNDRIASFSTTINGTTTQHYSSSSWQGPYINLSATQTITQTAGQVVTFTEVYVGDEHHIRIWVDWDDDGVFDDSEEVFYSWGSGNNWATDQSFSIPASIPADSYRMRVRSQYMGINPGAGGNLALTPCGNLNFGSTLDFTLAVLEAIPCTGTPTGGTAVPNPATANVGETFSVTVPGYDTAGDLMFQWEIYNEGTATWDPIGTPSADYQNLTGQIAPAGVGTQIKYRLKTTCTNSNLFAYSTEAVFETSLIYCVPAPNNDDEWIDGFSTSGAISNITNTANGGQSNGYADFTSMSATVTGGSTFNFTVNFDGTSDYFEGLAIWIDQNNNGVFETPSERFYTSNGTTSSGTFSGTITAPATAGTYRMRVVMQWNADNPNDPCLLDPFGFGFFGEVEDYTLVVIASCPPVTALGTSNVTQNSVDVVWTAGDSETLWNIEYGDQGFSQGSGTIVNGVTNPYTIIGLTAGTSYDVYVQANCGSGNESTWKMTNFTTDAAFSCPSPLNAGTVTATPDSGSAASTFDVTAIGYDTGADITYTWEKSEDSGATWILVGTPNSETYSDLIGEVAPASGVVEYRLTVSCGGNTQSVSAIFTVTVSRSDFDLYRFSYYPNPVNDILTLSSNQPIDRVVVSNMLGQEVKVNLSSDKTSLDMSNLANGNYFVKVTIEGVAKTIKIVKR